MLPARLLKILLWAAKILITGGSFFYRKAGVAVLLLPIHPYLYQVHKIELVQGFQSLACLLNEYQLVVMIIT